MVGSSLRVSPLASATTAMGEGWSFRRSSPDPRELRELREEGGYSRSRLSRLSRQQASRVSSRTDRRAFLVFCIESCRAKTGRGASSVASVGESGWTRWSFGKRSARTFRMVFGGVSSVLRSTKILSHIVGCIYCRLENFSPPRIVARNTTLNSASRLSTSTYRRYDVHNEYIVWSWMIIRGIPMPKHRITFRNVARNDQK